MLIFFDALMVDTVMVNHSVHSEEFRALITKHDLFKDAELGTHIESVVDNIWAIDSRVESKGQ